MGFSTLQRVKRDDIFQKSGFFFGFATSGRYIKRIRK